MSFTDAGRQYEKRHKELSQERVNEAPELVPAYDHCLGCKLWRDEERRWERKQREVRADSNRPAVHCAHPGIPRSEDSGTRSK